ncbi:hypothetical protein ASPCAL11738 [Aspergillus calidoustus]|uniref:Nascent polypeptide-associated complex subunit alpha-like UBA domain-containing protein n=1 Tax=Aspergillus calidoustus TaxID=454130 RepID=A0A0U5GC57_ASPCI|nr:hypothetical protein ASPCAL11738 [Aspergillus calidoustus]
MSDPVPSASEHNPTTTSTSAEDRKAAAALSSLNTTEITSGSPSGEGAAKAAPSAADQEALGKAMSRLEIASGAGTKDKGGKDTTRGGKEIKKKAATATAAVKVAAEDVTLLVNELDLNKIKATELLKANGGDAKSALRAYIRLGGCC